MMNCSNSRFDSVDIRKFSYKNNKHEWVHFPYRSGLSVNFTQVPNLAAVPQNQLRLLIFKVMWNAENLETLTFEEQQTAKVYSKYPSIAIKYYHSPEFAKRLQLSFSSLNGYQKCIEMFEGWGITVHHQQEAELPYSQTPFSQSMQSQSQLSYSPALSQTYLNTHRNDINQGRDIAQYSHSQNYYPQRTATINSYPMPPPNPSNYGAHSTHFFQSPQTQYAQISTLETSLSSNPIFIPAPVRSSNVEEGRASYTLKTPPAGVEGSLKSIINTSSTKVAVCEQLVNQSGDVESGTVSTNIANSVCKNSQKGISTMVIEPPASVSTCENQSGFCTALGVNHSDEENENVTLVNTDVNDSVMPKTQGETLLNDFTDDQLCDYISKKLKEKSFIQLVSISPVFSIF
ncbi:hypothetical protein CANARDRAFT_15740 [[Candida] arabinofermentans NRRL YB-2248]|uniref:Uncharacterized protein n=1 Tax=[Candida] arabinofermentans NRRL YB-2248 TaxID=983967 RepID=A0A1E4T671_9ASCO|nr:hypothetical protein CANARDRAFT_15740 [[Candida] arabinofermentans NRRL YB-2248]